MAIPIIFDTDIGDDIDDALALTVALNSPEIHIVGITTVFRDAPRRALLARELLGMMGRNEVPVVAGCSQPLLPDWKNFPGGKALGRQFESLDAALVWDDTRHAVDFIITTVRDWAARGEHLTLVPIGALTNIALAFHLAPDIVPLCRVVLMGGKWSDQTAEWNILCDPEAAAMVFRSGADVTMVGLDVTLKCVLSKEQEQLFHDSPRPHVRFLGELIKLWGHAVTLHDPLTILTLFSDVVRFEEKSLDVGLHEKHLRARTIESENGFKVSVATEVDVDRATTLFMERSL
jgi:inosine-uridine nucleoside N-ribohydrolase